MPDYNTRSLYIKMKSATGSEVWRNVAPSVKSGTTRVNYKGTSVNQLGEFIKAFVGIQTEELALDSTGAVQFKIVNETFVSNNFTDLNVTPGEDSWTDTTNEKLVVNLTTGETDGSTRLPHAATAIGTGSTFTDYEAAVAAYSQGVASNFQVGTETAAWLNTHLTGTKDVVVAEAD